MQIILNKDEDPDDLSMMSDPDFKGPLSRKSRKKSMRPEAFEKHLSDDSPVVGISEEMDQDVYESNWRETPKSIVYELSHEASVSKSPNNMLEVPVDKLAL